MDDVDYNKQTTNRQKKSGKPDQKGIEIRTESRATHFSIDIPSL